MSARDMIQTFFPGQRKKMTMTAAGTGPLVGKDSQRRIKLALKMGLSDGKLTGMPEWISEPYSLVAKLGSATDEPKVLVELDGVNVEFYSTDVTEKAAIRLESCMLSGFVIARGSTPKNGSVPDVDLYFTLKTNGWVPKLWVWMADNLNGHFWMTFEGSQMSLSYTGPAAQVEEPKEPEDEKQGELIKEADYEAERKEALDPKKDAEWGVKPAASTPAKSTKSAAAMKAEEQLGGTGKAPTLLH